MKKVQSLNGQMAALSRFVSKLFDKCISFFNVLKQAKGFQWTEECEVSFQQLKEYMGQAPFMSKSKEGEEMAIYLGVSQYAISAALVREEDMVQYLIYYVSHRLLDAEPDIPQWRSSPTA